MDKLYFCINILLSFNILSFSFKTLKNDNIGKVILLNENNNYLRFFLNIKNPNTLLKKENMNDLLKIKIFLIKNTYFYKINKIKIENKQIENIFKLLEFEIKKGKRYKYIEIKNSPKSKL
jgi:hypothetical protein